MATITLTQVSNGDPGDATVIDNNFDTIANEINGNLTDANIKSNADINHGKILGGVRLSNRQDNTTNNTVSNQRICIGWGYKVANNDDRDADRVDFPITYSSAPIVLVSSLCEPTSGTPTAITDFNGDVLNKIYCWYAGDISTTFFNAFFEQRTTGSANGSVQGYTWMAIGTLAN